MREIGVPKGRKVDFGGKCTCFGVFGENPWMIRQCLAVVFHGGVPFWTLFGGLQGRSHRDPS